MPCCFLRAVALCAAFSLDEERPLGFQKRIFPLYLLERSQTEEEAKGDDEDDNEGEGDDNENDDADENVEVQFFVSLFQGRARVGGEVRVASSLGLYQPGWVVGALCGSRLAGCLCAAHMLLVFLPPWLTLALDACCIGRRSKKMPATQTVETIRSASFSSLFSSRNCYRGPRLRASKN